MTSVYWLEDPKILFDKENITELWPSSDMTYIEKMNTLCRLIILLTILGLIIFRSLSILIIGLSVLCVLTYIYNKQILNDTTSKIYTKDNYNNDKTKKENFDNMAPYTNNEGEVKKNKYKTNIKNPLNNHLISDSTGAEKKVSKKNSHIDNKQLIEDVRHNTDLINDIQTDKDLDSNFTLDRNLRTFYKVPDYDKSTIQYLTGNSATVKDNIFVNKNEQFIQ
jgi:hypothetical protein